MGCVILLWHSLGLPYSYFGLSTLRLSKSRLQRHIRSEEQWENIFDHLHVSLDRLAFVNLKFKCRIRRNGKYNETRFHLSPTNYIFVLRYCHCSFGLSIFYLGLLRQARIFVDIVL